MTEFFAPLPLLAVGLMVVNDRVLKPRLHNALTGKLSDLAVCFFLPLFVSALLGFLLKRHPRARIVTRPLPVRSMSPRRSGRASRRHFWPRWTWSERPWDSSTSRSGAMPAISGRCSCCLWPSPTGSAA